MTSIYEAPPLMFALFPPGELSTRTERHCRTLRHVYPGRGGIDLSNH